MAELRQVLAVQFAAALFELLERLRACAPDRWASCSQAGTLPLRAKEDVWI